MPSVLRRDTSSIPNSWCEDVFARRWFSKTSGKAGYQPVCAKEWNPQYCNKKKFKCSECPNRELSPLAYDDIYNHLAGRDTDGRDVIGVYALLEDNRCCFLCADFDDKNCVYGYRDDVLSFVEVCQEWDIAYSIEISRSGNGAHVWIFFNAPKATTNIIYGGDNFQKPYLTDLGKAKESVVISSPKIRLGRNILILDLLQELSLRGIRVVILTSESNNDVEQIKRRGINVILKENLIPCCSIIDKLHVWYGSINILGYHSSEDNAMRFCDNDIAGNLLELLWA